MEEPTSVFERPLTARFLFLQAARTFRDRFWRILAVAFLIALVSSLIDDLFDLWLDHFEGQIDTKLATFLVAVAVLITGANSFGSTFLAGVLDKTVGEHQHGHRRVGLVSLFLALPLFSLVGADLLVSLMRGASILLFILPGLAVVTFTAIVGPVIVIEKRRALPAIKRSAQLVRGSFWLVFRAVTILLMAESIFGSFVTSYVHGVVPHTLVKLFVEMPLAVFVALVEVTLAYQLIERDRPGFITSSHE